jgi:6-phospho-beta-glucosidase
MTPPLRRRNVSLPTSLFILGGSSFYTLLLVESLRKHGLLSALQRVTLFGRNRRQLEAVAQLCEALCRAAPPPGSPLPRFDATTDLEDCLDEEYGVLFQQIRFGGMRARDLDEKNAIRHGLVADETLGIVGVTNALRTISGLRPLLEVVQQKAHPYSLVNFTNPCSIVTQYLLQHWRLPVVGICDYPEVLRTEYARLLEVPRDELELSSFGVNHLGFVYDARRGGRSVFAELQQRLDASPLVPRYHQALAYIVPLAWNLIFDRRATSERQASAPNRASVLFALEQELAALIEQGDPEGQDAPAIMARLSERNCDWYDLIVTPALANVLGRSQRELIVNVGSEDALGLGCTPCVVEANAVFADGHHQLRPLPAELASSYEYSIVQQMKRAELALLDACLHGGRDEVVGACLRNPMIQEDRAIQRYLDDVAAADPAVAARLRPAGKPARDTRQPLREDTHVESTPISIAGLAAQGYLHIPGFLSRDRVGSLQRELRSLVADESLMVPRKGAEHFFEKYQSTSYCYVDRHAHAPTLAALLESAELGALVTLLLGDAGIFHTSLVQYHRAGEGQAIPWHQDIDAEALGAGKMFNFLIYPYDIDLDSGALFVVPGSQGSTRLPFGEPHGELPGQVAVFPKAGDLVITDCTLFHKVNHNHSGRDRMSVNLRFRHRELNLKQASVGIYRNGRVNYAG